MILVQPVAAPAVPAARLFPTPSEPKGQAPETSSAEVLGPLLRITQALSSEIESEKVYEAILGVVRDVTGAQRVSLQLLSEYAKVTEDPEAETEAPTEPQLVLVAGLGLPAAARIGEARPVAESVAAWVLKHRQPLLLTDHTQVDAEVRRVMRGQAHGASSLCVPLAAKGRMLGVVNAGKTDALHPFTETDRDFLAVLAGQAANAVEHARLYAQLARQAQVDGLTGLQNFAAHQARLDGELDRAARSKQQLALLHVDLDGFRAVNDEHGHAVGDRVLKLMSDEAIRKSIRPYDVASRLSGDDFAIILPHTTIEQAEIVAERVRRAISECDTRTVGVPLGTIGASIGVAHYPFDGLTRDDLTEMADNALFQAKSLGRDRVAHGTPVTSIAHIERDPRKLYDLLIDANTSTIEALAAAIDARDAYTAGHSRRVADHATALAHALGYSERFIHDLRLACLFHDVGKIGVPDAILIKPGKLSDEEFLQMKGHASAGADILAKVQTLHKSLGGIRHHHERWDGKGYPDGLAGEEIPELARVIAIADAYDAMTSNRVYRAAMPHEKVIEILKGGAGVQWDATMVNKWVELLETEAGAHTESEAAKEEALVGAA
jgi:diguanylate cyclase (GGDEF)-like protein